MYETTVETSTNVVFIFVATQAAEKEGTGLPLSGVLALNDSGNTVSDSIHDVSIATFYKDRETLDCDFSQLDIAEV